MKKAFNNNKEQMLGQVIYILILVFKRLFFLASKNYPGNLMPVMDAVLTVTTNFKILNNTIYSKKSMI